MPSSTEDSPPDFNSIINFADFYHYDKALELIAKAKQSHPNHLPLILRAEEAIRLARIAHALAPWRGSDFGRATPWRSAADRFDEMQGLPLKSPTSTAYFDKIIEHSISRLEKAAKDRSR